ncbi:DNA-binding transcriptional regulator cro [Caudoviricetes sp.]|jgi:hypothetical protein|nr:DNA-binding transcriptional regulator cro [Caudoviricetes sp.]
MENSAITPVELTIDLFGGVRKLARAINRDPAAVSRWRKSGVVPTSVQRKVLECAWARGIEISAHDMIFGRDR